MQQHANVVLDPKGNVIKGASVRVLLPNDSQATIYAADDVNSLASNPLSTDPLGRFAFFAPNGDYFLEISAGGKVLDKVGPVTLFDVADASDLARLSSLGAEDGAGKVGYGEGTVADALDARATEAGLAAADGSTKVGYGNRKVADKLGEYVSFKDSPFNAKTDGVTDNLAAFAAAAADSAVHFDLPPGTYLAKSFPSKANTVYQGRGNPTLSFFDAVNPVKAALQSDSRFEGINFSSSLVSLEWQRIAIEDAKNVTLRDCGVFGFRHGVALPNAWGLLIQRSTNVVIDNCRFGNNSQSDVAITDSVRDVTIINAQNEVDAGMTLNVEPNGVDGVVGMNVMGGNFREMQFNENNYTGYASRAIVVSGARITKLRYDGSGVTLTGCSIGEITNFPDGNGDTYAGALMIENACLGQNLITDERLMDVGASDTNSYWAVSATGAAPWTQAFKDGDGRYVRMNPNRTAFVSSLITRNFIPVTAGEVLIFFSRARVDNTGIVGQSFRNASVSWFDAGGTQLSFTGVINCRTAPATNSGWRDDVAIVVAPAGATQCKVRLGTGSMVSIVTDYSSAGLFRFTLQGGVGNMRSVIGALARPANTDTFRRSTPPSGSQNYAGYFVNDRVINSAPAVGSPKAWTCTTAGTGGAAGTWTSEGNL